MVIEGILCHTIVKLGRVIFPLSTSECFLVEKLLVHTGCKVCICQDAFAHRT